MKKEKHVCPTCGGITTEYVFTFSYLDAKLLLAMAREVRMRMCQPFTEANKIHLARLIHDSTLCSRASISSKLGLIAKVKENGIHKQGHWLITSRGWAALRGERVPAKVSVFRRQITERFEDTITIAEALKSYPDSVYNATEWYDFGNQMI